MQQTDEKSGSELAAAKEAGQDGRRKKTFSLKRLLWSVVRIWLLLAVSLYFLQGWLIFHPRTEMVGDPSDLGMEYEDIWLTPDENKPDEKINCWYVHAKKGQSKGVVMFCHGNASNLSLRMDIMQVIHSLGYDCFMPDYRGYGRSGGSPSEANMYKDVMAGWDYLVNTRNIPPENIVVHGRSLGGGAVSWLCGKVTPAGLVLDSTFTNGIELAQQKLPFVPIRLFAKFEFDTIGRINEIQCPILFIHSKDDGLIPISHRDRLYGLFRGKKIKADITGTHQNGFLTSGALYSDALGQFYQSVVKAGK